MGAPGEGFRQGDQAEGRLAVAQLIEGLVEDHALLLVIGDALQVVGDVDVHAKTNRGACDASRSALIRGPDW